MNEWWYLYEDQTIPIEWYAISHDGEFYPEDWRYTAVNLIQKSRNSPYNSPCISILDVVEQLKSGYSPYNGPVIFGANSFEGSLLYAYAGHRRDDMKSGDIQDIFPFIGRI